MFLMIKPCDHCELRYHCDEQFEFNCKNNNYYYYSKDELQFEFLKNLLKE